MHIPPSTASTMAWIAAIGAFPVSPTRGTCCSIRPSSVENGSRWGSRVLFEYPLFSVVFQFYEPTALLIRVGSWDGMENRGSRVEWMFCCRVETHRLVIGGFVCFKFVVLVI